MNFELSRPSTMTGTEFIKNNDDVRGGVVCDSPSEEHPESLKEWHSTYKHLILAAPDMLSELKQVLCLLKDLESDQFSHSLDSSIKRIRQVIAKAEGCC